MTHYETGIAVPTKTIAFTSVNTSTPISESNSIIKSTYTPYNASISMTVLTLMENISTIHNVLITSTTHTSVGTSTTTQGYQMLLKITVYVILLFIIVF